MYKKTVKTDGRNGKEWEDFKRTLKECKEIRGKERRNYERSQ